MFVENINSARYEYFPVDVPENMIHALPAGVYTARITSTGELHLVPTAVTKDLIVDLDTPTAMHVKREVTDFFDQEITSRLAAAQLKHRRGIILHGEAGTGKTSLVRAIFPQLIEQNAVILLDPDVSSLVRQIIPAIRRTDANRPIVIVFDEFHYVVDRSATYLLQLLDGLTSPDHIITIGTTNYMARIPKTICARPSRFSLVLEVPHLPESARHVYAQTKYPSLDVNLTAELVTITISMALDFLEEALKLAIMGYTCEDIVARFAASDLTGCAINDENDLYTEQLDDFPEYD